MYNIRLFIGSIFGLLSLVAFLGFYPLKHLNIQIVPLFQRLIFDFSIISILLITILIILTLIFGRIYCSSFCPLGILQEIFSLIIKPESNSKKSYFVKYIICLITLGALIGGSALLIRYIDPYSIFGSAITLSIYGIAGIIVILALVFFKNRFFCTNICPVGTILGLISKVSLKKIYMNEECVSCGMCAKNCPAGCINHKEKTVNNETCLKCFKCVSLCPKNAINYGKQPVKFSFKRRQTILFMGALALLSAGYAAGLNLTKNIVQKVKEVLLPAGAENQNRMANKCLNCNLCVNNCPNKIIVAADDNFDAIHLDYSKGKGYCDYNCKKCSEVCPSGAIKKISLEEKQKTRIGIAVISKECIGCGHCINACPVGAINIDKNKIKIDGSKCIGCGKCATLCKMHAIKIFAVNDQHVI